MIDLEALKKALEADLADPNGYWNTLKRKDEIRATQVIRMWDRIKDDVDGSIEHLLNWYESDKYRNREYSMGFEPREELLWMLSDVAEIHGSRCTKEEIDIYANVFTGSIYKLGSYIIQVMHGQGSVIRIDKIKQDDSQQKS